MIRTHGSTTNFTTAIIVRACVSKKQNNEKDKTLKKYYPHTFWNSFILTVKN